jgi:hypothetical protein
MMGLGQAAGLAAAQCAEDGRSVHAADVDRLKRALADLGANLGPAAAR